MIRDNYYKKNKNKINELLKNSFNVIAGPCVIQSADKLSAVTSKLSALGVHFLRGGSYKMRTRLDSFQGLGLEGLKILSSIGHKAGMFVVSEITSIEQFDQFEKYVDVYLVGMRNMFNYPLLQKLSTTSKPIILKRNFAAKISELLSSLSYLTQKGKSNIIVCERGIRTFEDATRNTLDLTALAYLRKKYPDLTIYADPSHASGDAKLVEGLALASIFCGVNGLIIEVDEEPLESLSDAPQIINIDDFEKVYTNIIKSKKFYDEQI